MLKKGIIILCTWFLLFSVCKAQEDHNLLYKTQLMELLTHEGSFDRLNIYIQDNSSEIISRDTVAKIICSYLNISPIYLSESEDTSSPYIERLIIEGIWDNKKVNPIEPISVEEWDEIWKHLQENKNNINSKVTLNNKIRSVCIADKFEHDTEVYYKDHSYKAYMIYNTNFIPIEIIKNMGMSVETQNESIFITRQENSISTPPSHKMLEDKIYLSDKNIYIGHVKTIGLLIGDEYYIPIKALNLYYDVFYNDQYFIIQDKIDEIKDYIKIDDNSIINLTDETIVLNYIDLFWDGICFVEKEYTSILFPNEKICKTDKLYSLNSKISYITTIISRIETNTCVLNNTNYFGQNNTYLLNIYSQKIGSNNNSNNNKETLDQLFPEKVITASLKNNGNTLKKGQNIEIFSAESGKYYIVLDDKKNKHKLPWNSLNIPKESIPEKNVPKNEEIESYINRQNIDSKTQYLVWTDLHRQRTYIFKGSKNNWKLIKNFLCSTGRNKTPTPKGLFELQAKIPYFGIEKGYRCKNAFQIYGDYLYHSIIFDKTGSKALEGKGVLGHQASEGCIRFTEEDSAWFYNTMTKGTRVWIR